MFSTAAEIDIDRELIAGLTGRPPTSAAQHSVIAMASVRPEILALMPGSHGITKSMVDFIHNCAAQKSVVQYTIMEKPTIVPQHLQNGTRRCNKCA